jgi:hypothetical protein
MGSGEMGIKLDDYLAKLPKKDRRTIEKRATDLSAEEVGGMKRKRWRHPVNHKTGRAIFTPVLRSTEKRLKLEVDYASFPRSKAPGFHGQTQDLKSGKWYAVYGKECDIPGCNCDAWVEEILTPAGQE